MLAAKRSFKFGEIVYQTPMVVPSFSSRGFDDVAKLIAVAREYITDEVLISAYDIKHAKIQTKGWTFPTLTFLDSGGYEKGAQTDLSDPRTKIHYPKTWTESMHQEVLNSWNFSNPTVIVTYDNPRRPLPLAEQIVRGAALFDQFPEGCLEILLKAETSGRKKPFPAGYLNFDAIEELIPNLEQFQLIGVTEKELGRSLIDRMKGIARLRKALTSAGFNTPIHVFGSLDLISTPLYFLSGADIFDGLTWLRFAYLNGNSIYRHNFSATELGVDILDEAMNLQIHLRNYTELRSLVASMKRFLSSKRFDEFGHHNDTLERCVKSLKAELLGGD